MSDFYDTMKARIELRGCRLLTPEEDYKGTKSKIKVTFSCGHDGEITYNAFGRKCTTVCTKCTFQILRNKGVDDIDGAAHGAAQEAAIAHILTDMFERNGTLEVCKTHEGCRADLLVRPSFVTKDAWLPIQLKTNGSTTCAQYTFGKLNKYEGMLLLLVYCPNNIIQQVWIAHGTQYLVKHTISIGKVSSRYDHLLVDVFKLEEIIAKAYCDASYAGVPLRLIDKYNGNVPVFKLQQVEHAHRLCRELHLKAHYKISYPRVDSTATDCLIDGLKIQDKSYVVCERGYYQGRTHCRSNRKYRLGDNHLYWFYNGTSSLFVVIPETFLDDNDYFVNGTLKKRVYLGHPYKQQSKFFEYCFDYENLDMERLKRIIDNCKNAK